MAGGDHGVGVFLGVLLCCVVYKVTVVEYLLCCTVFPLGNFIHFYFLIGEVQSQILYILRF